MKETSWRTLMLLTTLLAVFVIFQGTVRSPRLPGAQVQPILPIRVAADPNEPPAKGVPRPPAVEIILAAAPAGIEQTPEDPNGPNLAPAPVSE